MNDQERIHRLLIRGEAGERSYELPIGTTVVGRQPGCDIVLDDNLVSRRHARFDRSARECALVDLESSNGTRVDGERITPGLPVVIQPGAKIRIGSHTFDYEIVQPPDAVEAPGAPQVQPEPGEDPEEQREGGESAVSERAPERSARQEAAPQAALAQGDAEESLSLPPAGPPMPPSYRMGRGPEGDGIVPPGLSIYSRKLIRYLPDIYHTDFMARLLGIFESINLPIEWMIANFDIYLSPAAAPDRFLNWLASWYGISFGSSWDEASRRQFIAEAHWIFANLGTRRALARALEIYTGVEPEIDDTSEKLAPHTFRVKLPLRERDVQRSAVESLIDSIKPAHTAYLLDFKK